MRILIAGASGYLGKNLVSKFSEAHKLILPLRKTHAQSTNKQNHLTIQYKNYQELDNIFEDTKPDIVINCVTKYGRLNEDMPDLVESNLVYASKIFEFSQKINSKFINIGTSLPENTSLYALLKSTFVKSVVLKKPSNFINLKLEHFFGADDSETKFINYVFENCINNNDIELTSCDQRRDFIYIKDLVDAIDVIINNLHRINKNEYEIGCGKAYILKNIVNKIHLTTKSKASLKFGAIKKRENEPMMSVADISDLLDLGWKPKYTFDEAIQEMYESYSLKKEKL